jgi:predicted nucleic acid-binding protein
MPALADLPRTIVVDASVGMKWVVDEEGSDIAAALLAWRRLLVPDLFWIETANVLSTKVRRGELASAQAGDAWHDLSQAPVLSRTATPDTVAPALRLAQDIRHPVYDCVYLALAVEERCKVVTADRRFVEVVRNHPYLADSVVLLSEIEAGEPG